MFLAGLHVLWKPLNLRGKREMYPLTITGTIGMALNHTLLDPEAEKNTIAALARFPLPLFSAPFLCGLNSSCICAPSVLEKKHTDNFHSS